MMHVLRNSVTVVYGYMLKTKTKREENKVSAIAKRIFPLSMQCNGRRCGGKRELRTFVGVELGITVGHEGLGCLFKEPL